MAKMLLVEVDRGRVGGGGGGACRGVDGGKGAAVAVAGSSTRVRSIKPKKKRHPEVGKVLARAIKEVTPPCGERQTLEAMAWESLAWVARC
jgi:hypothetical protein